MTITRREAIIKMAVLMGATCVGPRLLAANFGTYTTEKPLQEFSPGDRALLDEIGDTIIPASDVPGAKAVEIGAFIIMMVQDCYSSRDQAAFKTGLGMIAQAHTARFGEEFINGNAVDRTRLLNELDQEQKRYTQDYDRRDLTVASEKERSPHYFRMMKELTLLGYFTSEIGCTQALRFVETPGRFDGGAPYHSGERAWFS